MQIPPVPLSADALASMREVTTRIAELRRLTGSGRTDQSQTGLQWTGRSRVEIATTTPSFAAVMRTYAPSQGIGVTSTDARGGEFGPLRVPPALSRFGNGRIPDGVLTPIGQGRHALWVTAAAAWRDLAAAAAADGIAVRVTDSYRSYAEQIDLAERKGLYRDGGLAAVPGTSSHGWGLAVDVDVNDAATLAWMRANAPRFGFAETTPREPWHWEYRPVHPLVEW